MTKVSHVESIIKAVSWRIFGSLATAGLVYGFTGSSSAAITVGGAEALGKILLFYIHERAWYRLLGLKRVVGGS